MALSRKNLDDEFREYVDDPRVGATYDGSRWTIESFVALLNANMRRLAKSLPPGALDSLSKSGATLGDPTSGTHNFAEPTDCSQVHAVTINWSGARILGQAADLSAPTAQYAMSVSNDILDGLIEVHPDFVTIETEAGLAKVVQSFWTSWNNRVNIRPNDSAFETGKKLAKAKVTVHYIAIPTVFTVAETVGGDAEVSNMDDDLLEIAVKDAARDALIKDNSPTLAAEIDAESRALKTAIRDKFKGDVADPIYTKQGVGFS